MVRRLCGPPCSSRIASGVFALLPRPVETTWHREFDQQAPRSYHTKNHLKTSILDLQEGGEFFFLGGENLFTDGVSRA